MMTKSKGLAIMSTVLNKLLLCFPNLKSAENDQAITLARLILHIKNLAIPFACLLAFVPSASQGQSIKVYDGTTADELAEFAKNQNWVVQSVRRKEGSIRGVTLKIKSKTVVIYLRDCNVNGRCNAGLMEVIGPPMFNVEAFMRGLNSALHGATACCRGYITLRRHLHFRGVTDTYLREVIGTVWVEAVNKFWKTVFDERKRYLEANRHKKTKSTKVPAD